MTWPDGKPEEPGKADRIDPIEKATETVDVIEVRDATGDGDGTVIIYE